MEFYPEATSHNHVLENLFENGLVNRLLNDSLTSVLDIGCGEFCRHAYYLAQLGFDVDIVEVPKQIRNMDGLKLVENKIGVYTEIPDKKYDAVLLNFVLNVLPTIEEREKILEDCIEATNQYLMVSVRDLKFINCFCKKAPRYNDGFILEKDGFKTFNIGYSKQDIVSLLKGKGLKILDYEKAFFDHRFICC